MVYWDSTAFLGSRGSGRATQNGRRRTRSLAWWRSYQVSRVLKAHRIPLEEFESWYKVKSEDAFIGFVEKKKVKDKKAFTPEPVTDYEEPEYTKLVRDHKINLAFHNLGTAAANSLLEKDLEGTHGLNAIAPMWLRLDDNSGKIDSFASSEYVEKAHAAGLEVWPILNNLHMRRIEGCAVQHHAAVG